MPTIDKEKLTDAVALLGPMPPPPATLVQRLESDRHRSEMSTHLSPWQVKQIQDSANGGDPRDQAKLAAEILEKDWDVAQAFETRVRAVLGTPWSVTPSADTDAARQVADTVTRALHDAQGDGGRLIGFAGLVEHLLGACLPGYAAAETVWRRGGAGVVGWLPIDSWHLTMRGSDRLRLATRDEPAGIDLPAPAFIRHRFRQTGDPARGGLIRPLAWAYAFKSVTWKDWLRLSEKVGMPFVAAKVDESAWETERTKISHLVKNFASDGGGVFTKAVDLELLEASPGAGTIHETIIASLERATAKILLGQTSTSDSRDSNRSTAGVHQTVRQDLLEADCHAVASTLNAQLIRHLVSFRFGPKTPAPRLEFACQPPADRREEAEILRILADAGYQVADLDVLETTFGRRFVRTES